MNIEIKTQPFNTFVHDNRKYCGKCKYCSQPRPYRGMTNGEWILNMYCKHPIVKLKGVKTTCLEARWFDDACGREGKFYEPK